MSTATLIDGTTVSLATILQSIPMASDSIVSFPIFCIIGESEQDREDYLRDGANSAILVQDGPMTGRTFQFQEMPSELSKRMDEVI